MGRAMVWTSGKTIAGRGVAFYFAFLAHSDHLQVPRKRLTCMLLREEWVSSADPGVRGMESYQLMVTSWPRQPALRVSAPHGADGTLCQSRLPALCVGVRWPPWKFPASLSCLYLLFPRFRGFPFLGKFPHFCGARLSVTFRARVLGRHNFESPHVSAFL